MRGTLFYTITARAEAINARGSSARNDSQTRDIEALFEHTGSGETRNGRSLRESTAVRFPSEKDHAPIILLSI